MIVCNMIIYSELDNILKTYYKTSLKKEFSNNQHLVYFEIFLSKLFSFKLEKEFQVLLEFQSRKLNELNLKVFNEFNQKNDEFSKNKS